MCLKAAKPMLACVLSRFSHVRPLATFQAPLSKGFSRQEYWSGCHALLQGIFRTQGWNLHLLRLVRWQVGSFPLVSPGKPMWSQANQLVKGYSPGLGPSHQEICLILHIMK